MLISGQPTSQFETVGRISIIYILVWLSAGLKCD